MKLTRKQRNDKNSTKGLIFAGIAVLGILYELIFSEKARIFLILMYAVVIGIGGLYFFYIDDID